MPLKTRPTTPPTLADRVRETMRLRNIGVNELGRRMNRKPGYVSAMLSQNRSPRAQNLAALPHALGVQIAWLVDGEGGRDVDVSGGAAGAQREDWVRALDRSDPFPNRRQLKLLDVYRGAPNAATAFLDDARFFPTDRPTVEEWLRELALAIALDRAGRLDCMGESRAHAERPASDEAVNADSDAMTATATVAKNRRRTP
jgi:transcriptional regulator with XRE-family HTH domain